MNRAAVIYTTNGFYEPGNKYYFQTGATMGATQYQTIADAQRGLISTTWSFTRWEEFDTSGHKVDEGTFDPTVGLRIGQVLPPKYCAFVRLTSAGPGRPSSKYFHGIAETDVEVDVPLAAWLTELANLYAVLQALDVCDSDGASLSGMLFRQWSRRRHVRRISE